MITSGCAIPGSPERPAVDDSVTLTADVKMPSVAAEKLLASVVKTPEDVFSEFLASSSCIINSVSVDFCLNASDSTLVIEKLPPANVYEVTLRCKDLILKAVVPWQGRQTYAPYGISVKSTADWLIRNSYASHNNMNIADLSEFAIDSTSLANLEKFISEQLLKSNTDAAILDKSISENLENLVKNRELLSIFSRQGKKFNFDGTWQGSVTYYTCNAREEAALAVYANVELSFKSYGNNLKGSGKIVPTGVSVLPGWHSGIAEPTTRTFAIEGTVSDHLIVFYRKEVAGPLAGKNVDLWKIFPLQSGIAAQISAVQSFSGIGALPGEFVLNKKD